MHASGCVLAVAEARVFESRVRSAQAFQVLFNAIIVELLVVAVWSPTSTSETCPPADANSTPADDGECTAGSIKVFTLFVSGLFLAVCLALSAVMATILFKMGNAPCKSLWLHRARWVGAWLANWLIFVACSYLVVVYARCMGADASRQMLTAWVTGCGISWGVTEPISIAMVILFPCIYKNRLVSGLQEKLESVGFDLSLFFG